MAPTLVPIEYLSGIYYVIAYPADPKHSSHERRPLKASIIGKRKRIVPSRPAISSRSPYTKEEDARLMLYVTKGSVNWHQAQKDFPGRTIGALRLRYYQEKKNCKSEKPDVYTDDELDF